MKQQVVEVFKGGQLADTMPYMKNLKDSNDYCLEILFGVALTVYLYCMVLHPTFSNWGVPGTWQEVQKVWDKWQTFNAAAIALLASVIAFKANTYHYHRERENNFNAARALLPQALSAIGRYTTQCARLYVYLHSHALRDTDREEYLNAIQRPEIPQQAIDTVVHCIKYSDADLGDYLAKILEKMQIIDSRIFLIFDHQSGHNNTTREAVVNIRGIARCRLHVNHLFPFARGEAPFSKAEESRENLRRTVIFSLGVRNIEIYPDGQSQI